MDANEMLIPSDPRFAVRYTPKGGQYGRTGKLTAREPVVTFFDTKHTNEHTDRLGQNTGGGYYVATILGNFDKPNADGLSLWGDVPEWTISPAGMKEVVAFLKSR